MTDFDWYSQKNLEVAADGIREEAKKWERLSDAMIGVADNTANQGLSVTAFTVTDVSDTVAAQDLKDAYDHMHVWLTELFRQAVTEMNKLSWALRRFADRYEQTEADNTATFDEMAAR
jgi:hypothetical protein